MFGTFGAVDEVGAAPFEDGIPALGEDGLVSGLVGPGGEVVIIGELGVAESCGGDMEKLFDLGDVHGNLGFELRLGIKEGNYSFGTAVGLFKSVVSLILVVGANHIAKKMDTPGIW